MGSARAICWFSPPVRYQRKGVFYHSYSPFWTTAPSVITNRAKFVCFSFYRQFIIKNTNLQYHSRIFSSGFSLVAIWFWKGVEDTNKRNKFSNLLFTFPLYIVPLCYQVEFWPRENGYHANDESTLFCFGALWPHIKKSFWTRIIGRISNI